MGIFPILLHLPSALRGVLISWEFSTIKCTLRPNAKTSPRAPYFAITLFRTIYIRKNKVFSRVSVSHMFPFFFPHKGGVIRGVSVCVCCLTSPTRCEIKESQWAEFLVVNGRRGRALRICQMACLFRSFSGVFFVRLVPRIRSLWGAPPEATPPQSHIPPGKGNFLRGR